MQLSHIRTHTSLLKLRVNEKKLWNFRPIKYSGAHTHAHDAFHTITFNQFEHSFHLPIEKELFTHIHTVHSDKPLVCLCFLLRVEWHFFSLFCFGMKSENRVSVNVNVWLILKCLLAGQTNWKLKLENSNRFKRLADTKMRRIRNSIEVFPELLMEVFNLFTHFSTFQFAWQHRRHL